VTTVSDSSPVIVAAAVVGSVAHATAAAVVSSVLFPLTALPTDLNWPYTYALVGSLVTGGVPVILYRARRVRAPAAVVAVLGLLAAVGSWQTLQSAAALVGPTPFGWYLLGWPVVVGCAVAAAGVELWLRSRESRLRPGTAN